MVDLLLKHGADKYLVAKLSLASLKQIGKKSQAMLRKWYSVPTVGHGFNEINRPSVITASSSSSYDENDESRSGNHSVKFELRPLSPIMAALCLDDVDIFARFYKHHHMLFNYFKPDEDYELIYYAIKFQSKNCLVYLLTNKNSENVSIPSVITYSNTFINKMPNSLSLPLSLTEACSQFETKSQSTNTFASEVKDSCRSSSQYLNMNVDTMYYILENTRSSRIVKVLLECGFDLSRREQRTGNTALHCLFNAIGPAGSKKPILNEYHSPRSLSKILFVMLKKGGLKAHVNTVNVEKKLSMEALFEWDELIETVFFENNNLAAEHDFDKAKNLRTEWQREFETCVHLLLKSGADLLSKSEHETKSSNEHQTERIAHNCLNTLFACLLKHSVTAKINSNSQNGAIQSEIYSTNIINANGNQENGMRSPSPLSLATPLMSAASHILKQQANLNESLGVNISNHPHDQSHHHHIGKIRKKSFIFCIV